MKIVIIIIIIIVVVVIIVIRRRKRRKYNKQFRYKHFKEKIYIVFFIELMKLKQKKIIFKN